MDHYSYNNGAVPLSTNSMYIRGSDFNLAFQENKPIIEKINYENQRNTLHNNISDVVLDEHVVEYSVCIDSGDRDITAYPDPFSYTVKFNPPSSSRVRTEVVKNGINVMVNDFFNGPPKPHIHKEFRNVKYIKLHNVILPQKGNIKINDDGEYVLDSDSLLIDDRYVSLVVDELDCSKVYSTSDNKLKNFAMIFPDRYLGTSYYTGVPYYGSKIFNNSELGCLTSLTVKFMDSCGKPLKYDNLFSSKDLKDAEDKGCPISVTDIRHPLNKKIQNYVSFTVGVVESQIDTRTKFER